MKQYLTPLLIFISAILAAVCIVGCFFLQPGGASVQTSADGTPESTAQTAISVSDAVLAESKDMGRSYIDRIIFLGDSTTYHLKSRGVLTNGKNTNQVWTGKDGWLNLDSEIANGKILYPDTNTEMTVAEAAALKKPEYMVITLGADYGVAYLTDDKFETFYIRLIDSIKTASPDTKIMLQSIFPVSEAYSNESKNLTNPRIDGKNEIVKKIAAECGLRYLDTASVLKGTNNAMKPEFDSGDGIHMTKEAYDEILAYIRTHAYA